MSTEMAGGFRLKVAVKLYSSLPLCSAAAPPCSYERRADEGDYGSGCLRGCQEDQSAERCSKGAEFGVDHHRGRWSMRPWQGERVESGERVKKDNGNSGSVYGRGLERGKMQQRNGSECRS